MSREFRLRDPVHNFIRLRSDEVKLIAVPLYQRLRGIKQLALASLVYPGALHTRFDHSLGVCHVAGLLAEQLGLSDDETELVRLAALLHDLGHGPFSHVSENLLEWYADRAKLKPEQKKDKIHELVTAHFIRTDPDIARLLSDDKRDQIVKLLADGHGQPALKAIVSGPLDADKQDYLLRDSYFCGVAYGVFDIHQFHRSLVLYGPDDDKDLMIDPDGIHAVEQYVLAKYYLTTNVYRHRVRLITDQMLVRAIRLGIDVEGNRELRKLYTFDGSTEFFNNYRAWDDARFMTAFGTDPVGTSHCRELIARLRERRLLKRVFSASLDDFDSPELREVLTKIEKQENAAARLKLEAAIAGEVQKIVGGAIDPRLLIIHVYTIKSVRVSSRNDEGSIMVARPAQVPVPFEDGSALFRSINEGYTEGYVEVYAPIAWDTETDKKRTRERLRIPIRQCIEAMKPATLEGPAVGRPPADKENKA